MTERVAAQVVQGESLLQPFGRDNPLRCLPVREERESQRMLTRTLRGLAADGLVHREVFPTIPPSVEYSLTPLGESLLVPPVGLADWVVEHRAEIAATRLSH